MKIAIFFIFTIITLFVGVVIIYLCPLEVAYSIVLTIIMTAVCFKLVSLTSTGKYYISILRGIYWGIQLQSFPVKFRVEKDVSIFNPRCVTFGRSCNIGKGAVIAPLGGIPFKDNHWRSSSYRSYG